jgi:hypothetical protein
LTEDILSEEISTWQDFGSILKNGEGEIFNQMLNECREYKDAINSKGELFSTESLFMSIIFVQQKMINELINEFNIRGKS